MTATTGPIVSAATVFDPTGMKARKDAYFHLVREHAHLYFTPEGQYRPNVENDRRITFWAFPALIDTDVPAQRELALNLLDNDPAWGGWNIFTTSSIASILVRERHRLTPGLIAKAERHLDENVIIQDGRKPCSGANDYQFHGFNDNMPAMAVRALIFAGDVLGRKDATDLGLDRLEGLCAHFQRRGMLSEYNSGTYTPITLAALTDVAECSTNREAAEMARACTDRVLLDFIAHWHMDIGHLTGSSSRAYLGDITRTNSFSNALGWYLGLPGAVDLVDLLVSPPPDLAQPHGPDRGYGTAIFCEPLVSDYSKVRPEIKAWANQERSYPYSVRATSDAGRTAMVQDRAWCDKLWSLGTASAEMWPRQSGQHLIFNATLARRTPLRTFRDRVSIWHALSCEGEDWGDIIPAGYNNYTTETGGVTDHGQYHAIQNKGSALVLANVGLALLEKDIAPAKLAVLVSHWGTLPDEMLENDRPLGQWDGQSNSSSWQFMRFGEVYIGIRMAGMFEEMPLTVRRLTKGGYMRVEIPIAQTGPVVLTRAMREFIDLGFVFEIADQSECGSFVEFRKQCMATIWEYAHVFYRNSRYTGRHGDLQIVDSIEPHDVRFMAVNGYAEEPTFFEGPGVDPKWLDLFGDGRRIRQRRIMYRPDFIGSPFYPRLENIVVRDAKRE